MIHFYKSLENKLIYTDRRQISGYLGMTGREELEKGISLADGYFIASPWSKAAALSRELSVCKDSIGVWF